MELDEKKNLFLNRFCRLNKKRNDPSSLENHFVLRGYVRDVTEQGIIFETTMQTSFISWTEICDLVVLQ